MRSNSLTRNILPGSPNIPSDIRPTQSGIRSFRPGSLLLAAGLLITGAVSAQHYDLKKSAEELDGPQQRTLIMPGGDILNVTSPWDDDRGPVTLSLYDRTGKQKYSHENKQLFRDNFRAVWPANNKIVVLCTDRNNVLSRYEADPATGVIGSGAPIYEVTGNQEDLKFNYGSSPDNNWHHLLIQGKIKHENGTVFQGLILDQQGNKTAAYNFTTPEDRDLYQGTNVVQNDNGDLCLIYNIRSKTAKDDLTPWLYTVVTIDHKTGRAVSFPVKGLPAGNLNSISWTFQGDKLAFAGTYSPGKLMGYPSVCSGTIDLTQKKVVEVHTSDILDLMNQLPAAFRGPLPFDAHVVKILHLPDGGQAFVFEVSGTRFYQSHYAPVPHSSDPSLANGTMNSYSITYHTRTNLYVLKLDRQNTPQWLDLITKKQVEADFVIGIGTGEQVDSKGNIRLFFVDDKKNTLVTAGGDNTLAEADGLKYKKNVMACVTIAPDGTAKKDFFEDGDDHEFRPILTEAFGLSDNELCFLAIKVHKAFTIEKTLNHSKFRLGTIVIK